MNLVPNPQPNSRPFDAAHLGLISASLRSVESGCHLDDVQLKTAAIGSAHGSETGPGAKAGLFQTNVVHARIQMSFGQHASQTGKYGDDVGALLPGDQAS